MVDIVPHSLRYVVHRDAYLTTKKRLKETLSPFLERARFAYGLFPLRKRNERSKTKKIQVEIENAKE